jgi:hypothetical protein
VVSVPEELGDDGGAVEVGNSLIVVRVVEVVSWLDLVSFPQPATSIAALPITANTVLGPAFIRTLPFISAMAVRPPCGFPLDTP